eukprot:jgi/Mesvir1/2807/Mv13911-RA.2
MHVQWPGGWAWLTLMVLSACTNSVVSDHNGTAFFCPCANRGNMVFSFMMHYRDTTTSTGALLRSGVQQAVRDRGLQLNEHFPVQDFRVEDAIDFLDAEVARGSSGIITTMYSELLIPSLTAANSAGIPVYLVGAADLDLVRTVQRRESRTGPVRASLRYIGPNVALKGADVARRLMASGARHVDCVTTDIGSSLWNHRCKIFIDAFQGAGYTGDLHLRTAIVFDLTNYVREMEMEHEAMPGGKIVIICMDYTIYRGIKLGLATSATKHDVRVIVYETAVEVLEDVREGRNVLAFDPNFYMQGYLAVALAAAERQTGQMVTSDIFTVPVVFGGNSTDWEPVTDAVMAREVCRAAGHPVCGDPGVVRVTPTGCACFNRTQVRFKAVSALPKRLPMAHILWQGLKDAQRDLPGSTFDWNMYEETDWFSQIKEYQEVTNGSKYYGAISMDFIFATTYPQLTEAIRAVPASGKPLYGGYIRSDPERNPREFLDKYNMRSFVGVDFQESAQAITSLASGSGLRHLLLHNAVQFLAYSWGFMKALVLGVVGEGYVFPEGIWDPPVTSKGSPANRTGAWALFVAPDTNNTAQVMNGEPPVQGGAFLPGLSLRLRTDTPAPDAAVIEAHVDVFTTGTLALLDELARSNPTSPAVRMLAHRCSSSAYAALLRQGHVNGEELLLGCVDEQPYLVTYLAAMIAALEQHTGEHVGGVVNTQRLIRAGLLPPRFATRAQCEMNALETGILKGQLGMYYPVCNPTNGCVAPSASSGTLGSTLDGTAMSRSLICSGHGSCEFPSSSEELERLPAGSPQGTCVCASGWERQYCEAPVGATGDGGGHYRRQVLLGVLLGAGLPLVIMLAAVGAWVVRLRRHPAATDKALQVYLRKRAPPRKGDCITAVVTDIEESTSLWEWNPAVMKRSLAIHHHVLRTLLPKYHGYESDTEGDSFSLVFHDPVDALGWAMAVQRHLLFPAHVSEIAEQAAGTSTLQPGSSHQSGRRLSVDEGSSRRRLSVDEGSSRRLARRGSRDFTDVLFSDWLPELLTVDGGKEVKDGESGAVLYRGLRVRMGIHMGVPDSCVMHANGRQHYQGEVVELTKAIQDASRSGGQVLMSMLAWHALGMHMPATVCHHMGLHELGEKLPHIHLMQVLPEEVAKRAPFAPLKSKQLRPSFFDAPAADCYVKGKAPTDPLVICFLYVGGAKVLRKWPGYAQSIDLLVKFVQGVMTDHDAYECEEKDGNFLLAFRSPVQAVTFAEAVQREAMDVKWPGKLLEHELAAEVAKPALDAEASPRYDSVVFRGLRLQIGLCMGVVSDCQPHVTTGRAAYFGPIVNRAARIAATAAPAQTLANREVYEGAKGKTPNLMFQDVGTFDFKVRARVMGRCDSSVSETAWSNMTNILDF